MMMYRDFISFLIMLCKSCSEGLVPLLCRLDFLPRAGQRRGHKCNDDGKSNGLDGGLKRSRDEVHSEQEEEEGTEQQELEVEWLFSEMEGHWCEGFFRAASDRVIDLFADAVQKRVEEKSSQQP